MQKAFQVYKTLFIFLGLITCFVCQANEIRLTTIEGEFMGRKNRESFKIEIDRDTIFLKSNQNYFKIYFQSTSNNALFAYRFIDLESERIITKNNYAYYTNIEDGVHFFEVVNINSRNIEAKTLVIIVEIPFWKQWWFPIVLFSFLLLIISVIIYFIFLYRFSQQTKLQRVRDNIASDLHDDVGATLSSISFFGEMMRSKIIKNAPKEEVLPLLDKLISTSKETIETMRGVVWTINPNNDNAIDFFQKLQSFGREMLSAKNIDFELFISDFENTKLPLDIQRNFFLFYKEVINNIAKHSKATYVKATIEALEKNAGISFKIIDNGVGFDTNDVYEGHGLKSLRKRTEELEGNLNVESAKGKGTSISLSFVLP